MSGRHLLCCRISIPCAGRVARHTERQTTINRTTTTLLSALAVLTLAVSGCGSEEPEKSSAAPTTAPSASATSSPEQSGAPTDAKTTAPGTELKLGERAVIAFKSGSRQGTIAITVTAIEAGDEAAFRSKFGKKADGIVPYYIRYTVENVDGSDLAHTSSPMLGAVGADGRSTGAIVVGSITGCERESASRTFNTPGAKYETCRLQGARKGLEVAGAEYDEGDYDDKPITWKK